jgi:hypothetical protein
VKRTAYSLAYLCHALAGGLLYATDRYWLAVPFELISRGLLWVSE